MSECVTNFSEQLIHCWIVGHTRRQCSGFWATLGKYFPLMLLVEYLLWTMFAFNTLMGITSSSLSTRLFLKIAASSNLTNVNSCRIFIHQPCKSSWSIFYVSGDQCLNWIFESTRVGCEWCAHCADISIGKTLIENHARPWASRIPPPILVFLFPRGTIIVGKYPDQYWID